MIAPKQNGYSPDLIAVTQRLGSPDPKVQEHSARTLREAGDMGLAIILTLWNEELHQLKWRSRAGILLITVALVLASLFTWSHDFDRQLIGIGIFIAGGLCAGGLWGQSQRQKNLARMIVTYEDRRLLQPLAQIMQMASGDASETAWNTEVQAGQKAAIIIRDFLQQEPKNQIIFPDTNWIVLWDPTRRQRPIRWVRFWLSQAILFWTIFTLVYIFLGAFDHDIGMIGLAGITPLMTIKAQGARLQSDIVYSPRSTPPMWKSALGIAACIGLMGVCIHLLTGHLAWWEIAGLAGGVFLAFWVRNLLVPTLLGPVPTKSLTPGDGLAHPQG